MKEQYLRPIVANSQAIDYAILSNVAGYLTGKMISMFAPSLNAGPCLKTVAEPKPNSQLYGLPQLKFLKSKVELI